MQRLMSISLWKASFWRDTIFEKMHLSLFGISYEMAFCHFATDSVNLKFVVTRDAFAFLADFVYFGTKIAN